MGRLLLAVVILAVLAACGSLPKPETRRTTETFIGVSDSRFPGPPIVIYSTDRYCGTKESAAWRDEAGIVEILVVEAGQGCILLIPVEGEDTVALKFKWLKKTGIRFEGAATKTDTSLGTVWVRRFVREDRQCYFFRHAFEAHHFSHHSDPTTFMMGYFCAQPGQPNDDDSIRRLVSSITVGDKPVTAMAAVASSATTTVASTLAPKQDFDRALTFSRNPPERDVDYSLNGKWAGIAEDVTGKFFYKRREASGVFELRMPTDAAPCRGSWRQTLYDQEGFTIAARWSVKCPGTAKASGRFRYVNSGLADMYGADKKGNFISFSLRAFDPKAAAAAASGQFVPFAWEGVASKGGIYVEYERFEGPGSLAFTDKEGIVDCKGGWFLDGRWSADCTNGRKLAGKSFRFQFGTILGAGKDDLGRSFRFGPD